MKKHTYYWICEWMSIISLAHVMGFCLCHSRTWRRLHQTEAVTATDCWFQMGNLRTLVRKKLTYVKILDSKEWITLILIWTNYSYTVFLADMITCNLYMLLCGHLKLADDFVWRYIVFALSLMLVKESVTKTGDTLWLAYWLEQTHISFICQF